MECEAIAKANLEIERLKKENQALTEKLDSLKEDCDVVRDQCDGLRDELNGLDMDRIHQFDLERRDFDMLFDRVFDALFTHHMHRRIHDQSGYYPGSPDHDRTAEAIRQMRDFSFKRDLARSERTKND